MAAAFAVHWVELAWLRVIADSIRNRSFARTYPRSLAHQVEGTHRHHLDPLALQAAARLVGSLADRTAVRVRLKEHAVAVEVAAAAEAADVTLLETVLEAAAGAHWLDGCLYCSSLALLDCLLVEVRLRGWESHC